MKRYIKSNEIPGGCCDGYYFDVVKEQNMDVREDINKCGKKYKFLGFVKSTTSVYGWRVTDGERYFACSYMHEHGVSSLVAVYQTNKKGEYDCMRPIKEYPNFCDIETCLDDFFETYVPSEEEFDYVEKEEENEEEEIDTDVTEELD